MGYLPQFKNDLFISYRRTSNEGQDPWVDNFCDSVRSSLRDLVGDVQMWRDTSELRAGSAWRPEIADAVDTAGIFLAVISRTYFDSDECRKELDRFLGRLKSAEGGGVVGGGRKLLPIFKHPPKPDQALPRELAEIGHHEFFNLHPKPWRELDPKRDYDDYHERLGRVVFDLMEALEFLQGQQQKLALGKVFIANTGPELLQERERLRTDLRQRGFLVLPEREILWNADDHRERIVRDLSESLLCIHLVARTASIEPLTPARARVQLELAHAEMKQRGRPAPLVWIQPAAETDAGTRPLIDYIENELANEGVDYLQASLEDLKTLMLDKLPKPSPPPAPPKPRDIAVLVEDCDLADLGPLKSLLADKLGVEPRPLKFSKATPKDLERLARTLASCQQVIIFWSRQSEDWVFDMMDLDALADRLGPDRLCIYAGGEDSSEKTTFATKKARLVSGVVSAGEAGLRGFLDALPVAS